MKMISMEMVTFTTAIPPMSFNKKGASMFLNGEELLNIAIDAIEEAVTSGLEDYEITNRVRGVIDFVHRMRDKKEAERTN